MQYAGADSSAPVPGSPGLFLKEKVMHMNDWRHTRHAGPTITAGAFLACLFFILFGAGSGMAAADDAMPAMDTPAAPVVLPTTMEGLVGALVDADFDVRGEIVTRIAASKDPRVLPIFNALLDSRLYSTADAPPHMVILAAEGDDPEASDAFSGAALGKSSTLSLNQVPIDNSLRSLLQDEIARLQLSAAEPGVRLLAAQHLITSDPVPAMVPLLSERLAHETDSAVADALRTVLALDDITSDEEAVRAHAVKTLASSLYPEVRAKLDDVAENDPSAKVRKTALDARAVIDRKVALNQLLQNIFFGLSLGSVLLLAAVGLAITFGVMGVINMAHGELIMLGAYTTYVLQQLMPNHIGLALALSVPAAFLVAGAAGVVIERGVIRYLYGRPLETLLATFGISLLLQQAVRSVFSPLNRAVASPDWMSGSLQINPVLSLTYNRIFILLFALVVYALLMLVLKRTSLGLKLRAVAQNRAMARAVGVRADWVDALTFGLGSGIAGVAGVALSQLTNVGPNLGQSYIIDSFMVVVFGGVGNLWGTLVGAMGLGVANKFLEPYAGAVLAKILVLVFIILFIQKRPRGLFPQKGRAAEA
jgi:urea transport system permease protein